MNSFDLSGKSAVVTGGGQGIGEGIAKNLAAAGASVIVAARHVDRIERVASEINAAGGTAVAMATDVTDTAAVTALADAAVEQFGGLHVWVNNAGGSPVRSSLSDIGDDEWEACLRLNLTARLEGVDHRLRAHGVGFDHQHHLTGGRHRRAGKRSLRRREGRRELADQDDVAGVRTDRSG